MAVICKFREQYNEILFLGFFQEKIIYVRYLPQIFRDIEGKLKDTKLFLYSDTIIKMNTIEEWQALHPTYIEFVPYNLDERVYGWLWCSYFLESDRFVLKQEKYLAESLREIGYVSTSLIFSQEIGEEVDSFSNWQIQGLEKELSEGRFPNNSEITKTLPTHYRFPWNTHAIYKN